MLGKIVGAAPGSILVTQNEQARETISLPVLTFYISWKCRAWPHAIPRPIWEEEVGAIYVQATFNCLLPYLQGHSPLKPQWIGKGQGPQGILGRQRDAQHCGLVEANSLE